MSTRGKGAGRRIALTALASLALVLSYIVVPVAGAATSTTQPSATIDSDVVAQIAQKGETTFWVTLKQRADVRLAVIIKDRKARAQYVYDALRSTASSSQAGIRAFLSTRNVSYRAFWIVNALQVTGDENLVSALAARPEVKSITPEHTYKIPDPMPGKTENSILTTEWGLNAIGAPEVWAEFSDRGEDIVVANIDTGVQWDHPALVTQYRGHHADGTVDHNYNWFDPSNVCGTPAPCDNVFHGTHTMGTMVGDDGDPGPNQIGVAPHAKWIAAKGCETNSCSETALIASGQWVIAPTDLDGNNPRPDLHPDIVNNSWGDGPSDPFYQETVQNWIAAGIFPAFANGNSGSSCNTTGVPAAYPESYGVGAFDISGNIAFFSSRGPSFFGGITKPNVAAPGVNVRSSVPGNGYDSFNGTSMATPHLAGSVALLWSASPALRGDVAATRDILDQTAVDTSDLSCGGTAGNNNVWGEGKLDVHAAVTAAPRGPTGFLEGTVSESGAGPIANATVHAVGPTERTTTTDASGTYSLRLPVGDYAVDASAFGYVTGHDNATVADGATTTLNFSLTPAPRHNVSGHVRDTATPPNPIGQATVKILGTPIPPATADAGGAYSFTNVPDGTYDVRAEGSRCFDAQTRTLTLSGADQTNFDFALPRRSDAFGYFCQRDAFAYVNGTSPLGLSGDDNIASVSLPFPFTFYGRTYSTAYVGTNGYLTFNSASRSEFANGSIPSPFDPNAAIYPFWDDLYVDGSASMWTQLDGAAPNRRFTIEWRNVAFFGDFSIRVNFEVTLTETGRILTQYNNPGANGRQQGNSATIGIENGNGSVAFQYSFNEATITESTAILYRLPPSAFVQGTVTDANDHNALAGANVQAVGPTTRTTTSSDTGAYRVQVPLGHYDITVTKQNYTTATAAVDATTEDATYTQNFALRTARAALNKSSLEFIATPGQTKTKDLMLSNTGTADLHWALRETGGGRIRTSSTLGLPHNPAYDPNGRTTEGLYTVPTPAGWDPMTPGDVIRHWTPAGYTLPWGVGFNGNVWLSDPLAGGGLCGFSGTCHNAEFTVDGAATGLDLPADWSSAWNADMALDAGRNLMCQLNVGGDNGIYCFDLTTGAVVDSITSGPFTGISQRGLAYRQDDDSFYVGGWNEGILYHVKGLSYPDKGANIGTCNPPDRNISGLAWNPAFNIVWEATNSPTDTIYELNPNTCAVLATLAHPTPGFAGGGLEMDEAGNLWMVSQGNRSVYLIDSGVPAFTDVPWLSENPASGTITAGGAATTIHVTVNTTGLAPGVYSASVFLQSDSGRAPTIRVPISLIVPAYRRGVDAASTSAYTDVAEGDPWAVDQVYAPGSYGYTFTGSKVDTTKSQISGTVDPTLYQSVRNGQNEYRFDNLPAGVYQIELRFAEISNAKKKPGSRLFDVIIENQLVLPALDIAAEVGPNAADDKSIFMAVTDGQLNVRLIPRSGFGEPTIAAIRVTMRPDR